jgi:formate hydrogenlyase subunit 3/multisubunit Na+/H+ antiporter MnhD subunit
MTAPLALLIGPLILAVLAFAVRRWPVAAVAGGVIGVLILGLIAAVVTPVELGASDALIIYGRSLTFTALIRAALLFTYAGLGLLFLLSLLLPQGSTFVPVCLGLLSPLTAALMVDPTIFGVALLLIVAAGMAILIQAGRPGSTLASVRYLVIFVMAVPPLLAAGWLLGTEQATFLPTASRLLLIAFLVLLAGFPFHIWVAPVVSEAGSLAPVVIFGLVELLIVIFCLNLLLGYPVVYRSFQFTRLLQISGVVTVLLAGILVLTAPSFGRLLAYILLLDIGATVLAFAFGTFAGIEATMSLLVFRTISLILAGIAFGLLRRQFRPQESGSDRFAENVGLAWRTPMSVALFAYGALSLAGLPLTPGFSGRWAVVLLAADESPQLAAILVMSVAIAALGLLRCLATLLKKPAVELRPVPETKTMRAVTGLALIAGILIALFPQSLLAFARELAELF